MAVGLLLLFPDVDPPVTKLKTPEAALPLFALFQDDSGTVAIVVLPAMDENSLSRCAEFERVFVGRNTSRFQSNSPQGTTSYT